MAVDTALSDLFFNHDVRDCVDLDTRGKFVGYNHEKMLEEATMVVESLQQLGVVTPTAEELVQDFYRRV